MNKEAIKTIIESRSIPVPESGCWIWTESNVHGYGDFRFEGKHLTAHRASYAAYNGDIGAGLHVLHKCDTRPCCNPKHLFLGTNLENINDSVNKGRRKGITRNRPTGLKYRPAYEGAYETRTKIPRERIPEIIQRRLSGDRLKDIAVDFGVDRSLISHLTRHLRHG